MCATIHSAKNEAKIETEKYKEERNAKTVLIPFHADRQLDFDKQTFFRGGYLFLQSVYYQLQMNKFTVLEKDKDYTLEEADKLIEKYLKGKVR